MTEDEINQIIKDEKLDTNKISDTYHTFGELYDHRITLFIALCNILCALKEAEDVGDIELPDYLKVGDVRSVWKSYLHDDLSIMDGWFIAGITFVGNQSVTYHLPNYRWDELKVEELAKAPKWDGHTPADVLKRIKKYLY